ncbi:MAG TPA: hypothetical protein VFX64_05570 [Candidatus Nitrosotalea sp.]|nr:hypothetical protein [Candidatus Nitrosotalea sp.]
MLRILFAVLVVALVGLIPENSYEQTGNNLAIFVQIKVLDSGGSLVSYLEPTKVAVTNVTKFNLLLDQNSPVFSKSFVAYGEQKFEVIKVNDTVVHTSGTIVSQNIISSSDGHHSEALAVADHDGYPVIPGDKVTAYWTIIRPVS